jgi:hypothetical protein
MDWKRGLFRLWVIFTVTWLALSSFAVFAFHMNARDAQARADNIASTYNASPPPAGFVITGDAAHAAAISTYNRNIENRSYAIAALTVPFAVLVAAAAFAWVGRGFRKDAA